MAETPLTLETLRLADECAFAIQVAKALHGARGRIADLPEYPISTEEQVIEPTVTVTTMPSPTDAATEPAVHIRSKAKSEEKRVLNEQYTQHVIELSGLLTCIFPDLSPEYFYKFKLKELDTILLSVTEWFRDSERLADESEYKDELIEQLQYFSGDKVPLISVCEKYGGTPDVLKNSIKRNLKIDGTAVFGPNNITLTSCWNPTSNLSKLHEDLKAEWLDLMFPEPANFDDRSVEAAFKSFGDYFTEEEIQSLVLLSESADNPGHELEHAEVLRAAKAKFRMLFERADRTVMLFEQISFMEQMLALRIFKEHEPVSSMADTLNEIDSEEPPIGDIIRALYMHILTICVQCGKQDR